MRIDIGAPGNAVTDHAHPKRPCFTAGQKKGRTKPAFEFLGEDASKARSMFRRSARQCKPFCAAQQFSAVQSVRKELAALSRRSSAPALARSACAASSSHRLAERSALSLTLGSSVEAAISRSICERSRYIFASSAITTPPATSVPNLTQQRIQHSLLARDPGLHHRKDIRRVMPEPLPIPCDANSAPFGDMRR